MRIYFKLSPKLAQLADKWWAEVEVAYKRRHDYLRKLIGKTKNGQVSLFQHGGSIMGLRFPNGHPGDGWVKYGGHSGYYRPSAKPKHKALRDEFHKNTHIPNADGSELHKACGSPGPSLDGLTMYWFAAEKIGRHWIVSVGKNVPDKWKPVAGMKALKNWEYEKMREEQEAREAKVQR